MPALPSPILAHFNASDSQTRRILLTTLISHCTPSELSLLSTLIIPRLKRDFLQDLPFELSLQILRYLIQDGDASSMARVRLVSRRWRDVVREAAVWKGLGARYGYDIGDAGEEDEEDLRMAFRESYLTERCWRTQTLGTVLTRHQTPDEGTITSLAMDSDWIVLGYERAHVNVFCAKTGRKTATLLGHGQGVWAVTLISRGGVREDLVGVEAGLPSAMKTRSSSTPRRLARRSDPSGASRGFGLPGAIIVSGSSDRTVRVWKFEPIPPMPSSPTLTDLDDASDAATVASSITQANTASPITTPTSATIALPTQSHVLSLSTQHRGRNNDAPQRGKWTLLHTLHGHTATLRCLKAFHGRPIVVSGARDGTLRVWDISAAAGVQPTTKVLRGHQDSVRCLDIYGANEVVSGSYDGDVRLWDVDAGICLRIFKGHTAPVYSVAYDGVRILSGGLDAIARVWAAWPDGRPHPAPTKVVKSCPTVVEIVDRSLAELMGHTSLVCRVLIGEDLPAPPSAEFDELAGTGVLVTGGADGRMLVYDRDFRPASPPASSPLLLSPSPPARSSREMHRYTLTHRLTPHPTSTLSAMQMLGPSVNCVPRDVILSAASGGRIVLSDVRRSTSGQSVSRRPGDGQRRYPPTVDRGDATGTRLGTGRLSMSASSAASELDLDAESEGPPDADALTGVATGKTHTIRSLGRTRLDTIWGACARDDRVVLVGLRHAQTVVEVWNFRDEGITAPQAHN